jgi:hypothetical protein
MAGSPHLRKFRNSPIEPRVNISARPICLPQYLHPRMMGCKCRVWSTNLCNHHGKSRLTWMCHDHVPIAFHRLCIPHDSLREMSVRHFSPVPPVCDSSIPRCVAVPVVWPTFQAGTLRYMTTTYSLVKYGRMYIMSKTSSIFRHDQIVKQVVTSLV